MTKKGNKLLREHNRYVYTFKIDFFIIDIATLLRELNQYIQIFIIFKK